jgi:hypothetical protein
MSNPDIKPKSKNKLFIGILAIVLIVVIVAAAASFSGGGGGKPSMSSKAGTYNEQGGLTIVLYQNGTATFDSRLGTWSILNSTTFEGTYNILNFPHTSYFTFNNNGFTSDTGKVYVKSK